MRVSESSRDEACRLTRPHLRREGARRGATRQAADADAAPESVGHDAVYWAFRTLEDQAQATAHEWGDQAIAGAVSLGEDEHGVFAARGSIGRLGDGSKLGTRCFAALRDGRESGKMDQDGDTRNSAAVALACRDDGIGARHERD